MKHQITIVILGTLLLLAAVVLPFAGLERFAGDHWPMIAAMALAAVGAGGHVYVWRPSVLEDYAKLASLAFFVLMLLGVLGLLSEMDASAAGLQASVPMPGWLGGY
ncbi:hypothetical protein ACERK3_05965 [Phycisphaerales bacterium AB-hyl4]|uniref:Uncharacterized protein n=1 Tax=Natronomicrosphaera hydrolytica TaxID=3242702 RepID=A0ABV4U4V3_9BACT